MMNVTIQPATLTDAPALSILVNSAYRGEGSKAGWTTEADLLDGQRTDEGELAKLINAPGNTILIALDEGGSILGCVYLQNKGAVMYLGMLTVQPQLQAKGIGRQLLAAGEAFAKQQGCTSIEMTVISIRHELIAWYNKHGYQFTGTTRPFPTDSKFGIAKQPLLFNVYAKNI